MNWRPILLLAVVLPAFGQTGGPKTTDRTALANSLPAFEVASVKPTEHGRNADGLSLSSDPKVSGQDAFTAINNSLDELIRWAYRVSEYQISGPGWLNDDSECFDIRAKMAPGTFPEQLRLMMRRLLEERFRLAIHRETKMLPVYELVVARGGAKLSGAQPDAKTGISYEGRFWSRLSSENTSAAEFASFLSGRLNLPVIDNTGIQTRFAAALEYRFDDNDTAHPSIFTALEERWG